MNVIALGCSEASDVRVAVVEAPEETGGNVIVGGLRVFRRSMWIKGMTFPAGGIGEVTVLEAHRFVFVDVLFAFVGQQRKSRVRIR